MITRSGVMVDGADVGEVEYFNIFTEKEIEKDQEKKKVNKCFHQDLRNAEMVAIDIRTKTEYKGTGGGAYPIYAIYGDKIVTTSVTAPTLTSYWNLLKEKIVLVNKRPYILSGDCYRKNL